MRRSTIVIVPTRSRLKQGTFARLEKIFVQKSYNRHGKGGNVGFSCIIKSVTYAGSIARILRSRSGPPIKSII